MTKHTPGPWTIHGSDNATPHVMRDGAADIHDLNKLICAMPAEISQSFNSWANARLIAAAPELLAALEHIAEGMKGRIVNGDMLTTMMKVDAERMARAAILKATGEKV